MHGDGLQTRGFIHLADAVGQILRAAEHPGSTINVTTGRATSNLELAAAAGRALGVTPAIRHSPPLAGDIRHSCAGAA